MRVLIVDDHPLVRRGLRSLLLDHYPDAEIVEAGDAKEAVDLLGDRAWELALVDINLLDGMTGPDIARRLIKDHGTAVVFLTANPEQIPDGFAGALGAVSKPFDEATILGVVAFARQFIRHGAFAETPRRFSPAPWLTTVPNGIAPR